MPWPHSSSLSDEARPCPPSAMRAHIKCFLTLIKSFMSVWLPPAQAEAAEEKTEEAAEETAVETAEKVEEPVEDKAEKADEPVEAKSEEKAEEKADANGNDAEGDASEEGDAEAKITPSPTKGKTADGKPGCVDTPLACLKSQLSIVTWQPHVHTHDGAALSS